MDFLKKKAGLIIFLLIIAIFAYFRIGPLQHHTVAYTYDQGRDFLKAGEIIRFKNPTFIGPTTGIAGIYHGAWYYYYLAIPFLIFGGLPIGFYYFQFLIYFVALVGAFYFFNKYFDRYLALLVTFLIATSPYFIGVSFFMGNNTIVPHFFLLFLILNYLLFQKKVEKKTLIVFLTGFSLGMIAEFEFAFGLLLIPVYLIFTAVFKELRSIYKRLDTGLLFFAGMALSFALRILFELKNNFMQIRTLLGFILKPKFYTPKPYRDILIDRVNLFWGYYQGIFNQPILIYGFLILFFVSLFFIFRKKLGNSYLYFLMALLVSLFLISTFYKDTFWGNYYEGIQYLFVFLIASSLQFAKKIDLKHFALVILLIGFFVSFKESLAVHPETESLANQERIVNYVVDKAGGQTYCLKVYTPPVIPHTFNYLLFYKDYQKVSLQPVTDWVNDSCWYIVEKDDYEPRRDEWLKNNLPEGGKKSNKKKFLYTDVFYYQK